MTDTKATKPAAHRGSRSYGGTMKVCGIELSGSSAVIVTIDGIANDFTVIDTGIRKLAINNSDHAPDVISFYKSFESFIRNHKIEHIAIKWRNPKTKGWMASGPLTFKLEGIIQLNQDAEVGLINPNTINARVRKNPPPKQTELFKYQKEAYLTAYTFLRLQDE